jgi:hypothetical protein
MTYDPNDPRRPDMHNRVGRDRDGMGTGTMLGIALAVALGLGALIWAMSGDDNRTASRDNAPTTTGQRTDAPKPMPAPERTPAPSPAPKAQ